MKKFSLAMNLLLLALAIMNYSRLSGNEDIRAIQFLSIWAIGALSGIFILNLVKLMRENARKKYQNNIPKRE